MRELIIVRHGKSDWNNEGWPDIDRPLKNRGLNDAYKMADILKKEEVNPDLMISSPANRAIHTALIFARVLMYDQAKLAIEPNLYLADYSSIFEIVKNTPAEISTLCIFGHNPGFTDFANLFMQNYIDNVPTTGVVRVKFECNSWDKLNKDCVVSSNFDYPRMDFE